LASPRIRTKRSTGKPKKRKRIQIADDEIRYTNVEVLKRFLSERGKIRSRSMTGLSRRQQALAAREVKRARELSLLPYVMEKEGTARGGRRERGERGDRDRDR
jgi:small subunit ribosomal protein S18